MKLIGIDYTSAPTRKKPITVAIGRRTDEGLALEESREVLDLSVLAEEGPFVAALDAPFSMPRAFWEAVGVGSWEEGLAFAAALSMPEWVAVLRSHKEARRETDRAARSQSPMKCFYTPVGRMFRRLVPTLMDPGLTVPGLRAGDGRRVLVEAYPALVADRLGGTRSYKAEDARKDTPTRRAARERILAGLPVRGVPPGLAEDSKSDRLDALLALTQADWAAANPGYADGCDPLEGRMADAGAA